MFPLFDDNDYQGRPWLTWIFMAACIVIFFWQVTLSPGELKRLIYSLGMIPAVVFGSTDLPADIQIVPDWATLFTSMFLHGDFMHLAGNMLYLWIFGDNIEMAMGRVRFLFFYAACGVAAALTQAFMAPGSEIPMIGASGAISGGLGAYLLLFPRGSVGVLVAYLGIIYVPAVIVLGLWFLIQFLSGVSAPVSGGGVAFWAHVGGFVAGMVLIPLFRHRKFPMFGGQKKRPFQRGRMRDRPPGPWGPRPD